MASSHATEFAFPTSFANDATFHATDPVASGHLFDRASTPYGAAGTGGTSGLGGTGGTGGTGGKLGRSRRYGVRADTPYSRPATGRHAAAGQLAAAAATAAAATTGAAAAPAGGKDGGSQKKGWLGGLGGAMLSMIGWRRTSDQANDANNPGSRRQEAIAGGADERAELSLADGMAAVAAAGDVPSSGKPLSMREYVRLSQMLRAQVVDPDATTAPVRASAARADPSAPGPSTRAPSVVPASATTPARPAQTTPFHTPGVANPTPFHTPGAAAAATAAAATPFFDASRTFTTSAAGAGRTVPGRGLAGARVGAVPGVGAVTGTAGAVTGTPFFEAGARFATPVASGRASPAADVDGADDDEDEEFHTPDGGASPVDIAKAYMRGDLRAAAAAAAAAADPSPSRARASSAGKAAAARPRASASPIAEGAGGDDLPFPAAAAAAAAGGPNGGFSGTGPNGGFAGAGHDGRFSQEQGGEGRASGWGGV
ncbi:hypothetical protein CLOP_g16772 [Closterium sp. NIES-67]|nr:hypothetical protein CLOP_g16772 [Closterium sp. NIES-67]